VIPERIPEAVQLAADRFDVLGGRRASVLGVLISFVQVAGA